MMEPIVNSVSANGFVIVGTSPAAVFARGGLACVCIDAGTAKEWCTADGRQHGGLRMHDQHNGVATVEPCKWVLYATKRNGDEIRLGRFTGRGDASTAAGICQHVFKKVRIARDE